MIKLVTPTIDYKKSFLLGYTEFLKEGTFIECNLEYINNFFPTFIEQIKDLGKRKFLNPFYIPETIYWLVDEKNKIFIGRVGIRHSLNKDYFNFKGHIGYAIVPSQRKNGYGNLILKLALEKAKLLTLNRVLLTCNSFNIPSKKIIEKNGGIFENYKVDFDGTLKLRYWINI